MSDCPHCRTLAEQNNKLAVEVAALQAETLQLVYQKRALKRELDKEHGVEPLAREITAILKLWRALCVPTERGRKSVCIELVSSRAAIVRAALKTHTTGTPKERRRMCMDAIRGLALRPYVVNAQRKGAGTDEQRYCDVEHALGGDKKAAQRIEEHAGFYRMAHAKPEQWHERAYCAAVDVSTRWFDLWMSTSYEANLEQSRERLRNDPEAVKAHAAKSGFTGEQIEASIHGRPVLPAEKPRLFVVPNEAAA